MGNFLDNPITDKETHEGKGNIGGICLSYGVSSMQGWGIDMEDAHAHDLPVAGFDDRLAWFAVLDGHGGNLVSITGGKRLWGKIAETEHFVQAKATLDVEGIQRALIQGSIDLDAELRELPEVKSSTDHSGSTVIGCVITPSHVIFSNCGDSRAIAVRDDAVLVSTKDHKPNNPNEEKRIRAAGGTVSMRRVNGDLAVSRAIGDFGYKTNAHLAPEKQQVSAEPETYVIERSDKDQFILLACDGIWDVMTNEAATSFCLSKMRDGYGLGSVCEMLIDHCLKLDSRDNMSAIIVAMPNAPPNIGTKTYKPPAKTETK